MRPSFNIGIFFVGICLLFSGCETQTVTNRPKSDNSAVQTTPAAAEPQPQPARDVSNVMITLPLLDALLADEEFVGRAKTEARLSDEDIEKLRNAAREGMAELSEDGDDASRSTQRSIERARRAIEEALGRERSTAFLSFVATNYGDNGTVAAKPNSVPSDTRVVVNAPAYRMDIFENGNLVKTYKIGIGYPEFPLPQGTRTAKTIIFNPKWTPPDEPWVKGKYKPYETVEAGSKLNPLGLIKIPIGLPSLIHGGKAAARLGTFASHGCVGLTNAQVQDVAFQFARIGGGDLTLNDVKGYEKKKTETKEVQLQRPITVELRYETIVVENGTLHIYRDVYERGTNTEENLRKVLDAHGTMFESLPPELQQQIRDALGQMAVDATGKPVDGIVGNSNANANSNSRGNATSNRNSNSGRVTRDVKGQKAIAIPLPQLAGKGYPAPKDLSLQ
jgi:hypothetical protein